MIYLDNSATSFPKPKGMITEMENCMENYCGNPGRSGHYMSTRTGEEIYEARKPLAKLLGIEKLERIIFTKNTTEALNIGFFGTLCKGDHVITTSMEHNSVLRPLNELEKWGITYTIVKGDKRGRVKVEDIENAIEPETKMIAITAASNITGTIMPLVDIGKLAAERDLIYLVDGAQLIGHKDLKVGKAGIDILAFPGHKGLLGPQGTGGLFVNNGIKIRPLLYGGTGTESKSIVQPEDFPEGFESGTINSPGIIGLGYSVKFINEIGIEAIAFQEEQLIKRLDDCLQNMKHIEVYGPNYKEKTGVTLFNIEDMNGEEVTEILSRQYGIAVRGGFHCAGYAHKTVGTSISGAIRASVGIFNSRADIDKLVDAVWQISKN